MRVSVDITAVSVTIEDDCQHWGPEVVETFARIAAAQALDVYNVIDTDGMDFCDHPPIAIERGEPPATA